MIAGALSACAAPAAVRDVRTSEPTGVRGHDATTDEAPAAMPAATAVVPAATAGTGTPAVASAPPALPASDDSTADVPAWVTAFERLDFYGDVRLRSESNFLSDADDRHRQRVRVRVGGNYRVNDELTFGARVVTGDPDDPNSPHSTLGDAFNGIDISLDRAFLTWRPAAVEGAALTGGKFAHPFAANPVYSELVWDADVQPEGGVVTYSHEGLGAAVGVYTLLEQGSAKDAFIITSQLSASTDVGDGGKARGGVGYYYYTDVDPDGSSTLLADNAGNAVEDTTGDMMADSFVSDFGVLDAFASYELKAGETPIVLAGEYIYNTRAEIDQDSGYAAGFSVGKNKQKGDWRFYYQWQVVEQDAVFSAFAQDDFLFQTNHRSHLAGVNYQLTDTIGLHLWNLVSRPDDPAPGQSDDFDWRLRLDLNVKL